MTFNMLDVAVKIKNGRQNSYIHIESIYCLVYIHINFDELSGMIPSRENEECIFSEMRKIRMFV